VIRGKESGKSPKRDTSTESVGNKGRGFGSCRGKEEHRPLVCGKEKIPREKSLGKEVLKESGGGAEGGYSGRSSRSWIYLSETITAGWPGEKKTGGAGR